MKVTQSPISGPSTLEGASGTQKISAKKIAEATPKPGSTAGGEGGAAIHISDQARLMKETRETVNASADIRADKVAQLKRRIKDGSYRVDSAAVADKLVDEHLASNFGKNNL